MKRCTFGLLLAAALLSLHCGYRLAGRGNTLPVNAVSIAIPVFKNQTSRPQVEQFVTFAIRNEFIRRSRLRLVESIQEADLLLEGTITTFKVSPAGYSSEGAANLYEVRLLLDARLIDLNSGEVNYQASGLSFQETYETDSADFFSQETASLDKIAAKFAASIVTAILENF